MADVNDTDLDFADDVEDTPIDDVTETVKADNNAHARRMLEIKREERALHDALKDYYD